MNDIQAPRGASPLVVMGNRFSIEPSKLMGILKSTVIKVRGRDATNEEVAAFVVVANEYNLNPFTRQLFAFVGQGGAVVPVVSVDGWAAVVNRHPEFDGCEFTEANDKNGNPVSVTCAMYAKGRSHPVRITEWYSECYRETEPWKKMPRRMLRHKAFMQAGRYCFGLTGIFDEDEGRDIVPVNAEPPRTALIASAVEVDITDPLLDAQPVPNQNGNGKAATSTASPPRITKEQYDEIQRLCRESKLTTAQVNAMTAEYGAKALMKLTQENAAVMIARLQVPVPDVEPGGMEPDESEWHGQA